MMISSHIERWRSTSDHRALFEQFVGDLIAYPLFARFWDCKRSNDPVSLGFLRLISPRKTHAIPIRLFDELASALMRIAIGSHGSCVFLLVFELRENSLWCGITEERKYRGR
jgi:hypothetical protein